MFYKSMIWKIPNSPLMASKCDYFQVLDWKWNVFLCDSDGDAESSHRKISTIKLWIYRCVSSEYYTRAWYEKFKTINWVNQIIIHSDVICEIEFELETPVEALRINWHSLKSPINQFSFQIFLTAFFQIFYKSMIWIIRGEIFIVIIDSQNQ